MSIPGGDSDLGLSNFFSTPYQVHNRARLAHLESLCLPLANRRVLELGSGPGDHTGFYVERGCAVVSVDARQECLDVLKQRYPGVNAELCDLNDPAALRPLGAFEVIHCYGILYHLEEPSQLIRYMGEACSGLAVVETCVKADRAQSADIVDETVGDFTQSSTGRGSRLTRQWVFEALGRCFPFVYQTQTQPNHPEFPVNWYDLTYAPPLIRAVFVASKQPLDLPSLSPKLLDVQHRLDPAAYIGVLECFLAEQRTILEEREQLCLRLHATAGEHLTAMQDRDREIEIREQRIANLESVAAERLTAMLRTAPAKFPLRVQHLLSIREALEAYQKAEGRYPGTEGWDGIHSNWGKSTADWVPGLVPRFLPDLPRDPRMGSDPGQQYLYRSDGTDFKLIAHQPDDYVSVTAERPGFVDPTRPGWAYGFWSAGAVTW